MVEKREIELIPREIEAAKGLEGFLTRLRFAGLGILGLGVIFSAAAWGGVLTQEARLGQVEDSVSEQISQLSEFVDTEKMVLGLAVKSSAIVKIFNERNYFSLLLNALSASTPSGISVKGLASVKDSPLVTISGDTVSYSQLSAFLKNLIDPAKGGNIFVEASLTSVVQDSATGRASFVVEATMATGGLRKALGAGQ